jgi:hypothetical protein
VERPFCYRCDLIWQTPIMADLPTPRLLTVRDLREALAAAHPDQVISFSLDHDNLASLGAALLGSLRRPGR